MQHQKRWFGWWHLQLAAMALMVGLGSGCEGSKSGHNHDAIDFGDNDRNIYVALGDSITASTYYGAAPYPPRLASMLGKTVINEGRSGEKSGGGASRVNSVLARHKPGYLLVLYGANDLIHGRSHDHTIGNLRHIIRAAKNRKTVPVIATLTPMTGRYRIWAAGQKRLSQRIRELAREENVWLVDLDHEFGGSDRYMSIDGIHPNEDGCQLIAMSFYDELR